MAARDDVGPILNGLPSQLPDIDPEETQEWLDSLDGVIDERGRTAGPLPHAAAAGARAGEQVGVPVADDDRLRQHHPAEREPWFPGDEEVERRYPARTCAGTPR